VADPHSDAGAKARFPGPRGTPEDAATWGADHSFTLQALMHLTETTGGLTKAVEILTERVEQQQRTIRWMSRVLWMAGGAMVVLAPIVAGWSIIASTKY